MHKRILGVLIIAMLLGVGVQPLESKAQGGNGEVYLPAIFNNQKSPSGLQIANVPYFPAANIIDSNFQEMGIFWFGKVRSDTNYTDVRIGYNDEALWVHASIFDRRLWYNSSSAGSNLEGWDAATLLLHLDGNSSPLHPETNSYRFVSQLLWWEDNSNYQAAYRGNGSQWVVQPVTFPYLSGWRGNSPNDSVDDRGWTVTFKIPFANLGLAGKPSSGTIWRLGLMVHDRDSEAGPALVDQVWPDRLNKQTPSTWGRIRFGIPEYTPPPATNLKTTTIRQGQNSAVVPDVNAGGWTNCGDGLNFWTQWGEKNYAGQVEINIQNQKDVSDWPCFSKYYVTFPLVSLPSGKIIKSAKLVMHQFGGSDPANAYPSIIQALRVTQDWEESTLNWNNAPQAMENFSQTWVDVYPADKPIVWPGDPYEWDVSRAVAQAYQEGQPLRLALYSADSAMHSGKYFRSSNDGDWNAAGRPTLVIEWGDPQ